MGSEDRQRGHRESRRRWHRDFARLGRQPSGEARSPQSDRTCLRGRILNNELDVRILNEHRREDADLRGHVLQALVLDSTIPTTVDATVRAGQVTLTGVATWKYQRDEAEFIAGNVRGVTEVHNEIALATPVPSPGDVSQSIKRAFERDAKLQASNISVDTLNGTVRLTGTVNSWSEHDERGRGVGRAGRHRGRRPGQRALLWW